MAKSGKKLVYDISFITNIDSIAKQLKSDVGNIKINFPTSNLKANEYIKSLESSLKNFDSEYKNMIKNISQPNVSSKQIMGFISSFKSTIDATRTSLQSFKSSLNNTFKAADNQAMIASLKELEKQLERVRKAGQSIGELRKQKVDISKQVSSFMGKPMPYSKLESTLTRYDKLSAQSTNGKMKTTDRKWMDSISPSIEQLGAYKVQIDKVQSEIEKQVAGIKDSTGGVVAKGTKAEFGIATAQILNQIKEVSATVISSEAFEKIGENASTALNTAKQFGREYDTLGEKAASSLQQQEQSFKDAQQTAESFKSVLTELGLVFSAAWLVRQFKELATASFDFYRSLDRALTEISIVSDLSRQQVQKFTSEFINMSKQTGMAIDDIAQASVIFFQQGLMTDEVLTMTRVTAQFAKVAGTTVENAADKLTAAVNGFRVGVEQAVDVADKLNAVAAKSAASINELSTAFEKAASMAYQAGISMDNYLAYIATMVEVTREAPENIGTSLKTIIARFQQIKEAGTSEDGDINVNQVETALKSVGIALRDDNNQLRDLEDVLAELGPLWNNLDRNTQAYLGTIIAGTRQQSRLIALMQNWDRSLELAAVSQNSAGMQALMHQKAMQGLEATINIVTNSWQKFLASLTNSDMFIVILKSVINILDTFSARGPQIILIMSGLVMASNKIAKSLLALVNVFKSGVASIFKWREELKQAGKALDDLHKKAQSDTDLNPNITGVSIIPEAQGRAAYTATDIEQMLSKESEFRGELQLTQQEMDRYQMTQDKVSQSRKDYIYQLQLATEAEQKAKIAAMQSAATLATTVLGAITTIVTLVGGLDKAWGQAAIGVTAAAGAIVLALKLIENGINISTIGILIKAIVLGVTGLASLFSALSTKAQANKKAIEENSKAMADFNESIKAMGAAIRAVDSNIKTYEDLSKKIALTTIEQEKLNEAAKSLAEYYDQVLTEDIHGNYIIDIQKIKELRDADKAEANKQLEDNKEVIRDQISRVFTEEVNKAEKENRNRIISDTINDGGFYTNMRYPGGIGVPLWSDLVGGIQELTAWTIASVTNAGEVSPLELQDIAKSTLLDLKDALLGAGGLLNESSLNAVTDKEGNILASSKTTSDIDAYLKSSLLEAAQKQIDADILSGKISTEYDLSKAMDEYYFEAVKGFQELFGTEEGKSIFEDIATKAEQMKDTVDITSFDDIAASVDIFFKGIADKTGEEHDSATILAMKESFIKSLYSAAAYNIPELVERYKGTGMAGVIGTLSQESASRLGELKLFDEGDEGNKQLLQSIQSQLMAIDSAYKESGEKGAATLYKALSDAMNAPGATEEVKSAAEKAMQRVMDSLQVSSDKTWGQIADFLSESSESLRTMNDLVASLAENGGWTLDEFSKLASIIDSINLDNLSPSQIDSFTNAIDSLNIGIDASSGLINAQGDAVKTLRDLQKQAFLAEIEEMKNGLEAKIAGMEVEKSLVQVEIDTNTALMKHLEKNKYAKIEMSDVISEADKIYAQNNASAAAKIKENLKGMNNDSYAWARTNLANISKVGQAYNALFTKNYGYFEKGTGSLVDQATKMYKDVQWSGYSNALGDYTDIKGTLSPEDIQGMIDNLAAYNTQLGITMESYDDAIKNIRSKITALTNISTANLDKLGGSGQQKQIEEYVKRLTEMLNILREIERLDHRLAILGDYEGLTIGKQYTQVLLAQLDVVNQQKVKYKQLYDMQKSYVNSLAQNLLSGKYGKIVSFLADGTIQYDDAKYNKLSGKQAEEFDKLYEAYDSAFKDLINYHETAMQYWKDEIDMMQQRVDAYTNAENQILDAVKKREKDILDTKLDAVDKEIEAINKAAEARKKAREDEDSAKEISKLQTDLQRALMDTSAGSATRVLEIQDQIKQKQQEMADGSFDRMVDDEIQAREDQKTAEQDAFNERLENMDYYWSEVEKIMTSGTESIIETLKTYSEDYIQASDAEQTEIVNGWSDTFSRIADLGKTKVAELQNTILNLKKSLDTSDWDSILSDATRSTQQTYTEPVAAAAPSLSVGSYVSVKPGTKWYSDSYGGGRSGNARAGKIKYINSRGSYGYNIEGLGWVKKSDIVGYSTGGLNTSTGLAMLHGTTSQPEAVLNALQTKTFIKFTSALDSLTAQGSAVGGGLGSSVNIESIKFQVDNMSSEEDGRKAFTAFVDRFNEIGKQKGLSVRLPN